MLLVFSNVSCQPTHFKAALPIFYVLGRRLTKVFSILDFFILLVKQKILYSQDGSEEPTGPLLQKTPIILAKPPGERVSLFL